MFNQVLQNSEKLVSFTKEQKEKVIKALVNASKQTSKDSDRLALHYVHIFTSRDKDGFNWLNINSTDSHRAFYYRKSINDNYNFDELASADSIKAYKQGKTDKLETIETSSIKGGYPNMFRLLPYEDNLEIKLQAQVFQLLPFLKAIRTSLNSANAKNPVVDLNIEQLNDKTDIKGFTDSKIKIYAPKPNYVGFDTYGFAKLVNKNFEICFDYKYLIDALECFNKKEVVTLKFFNNPLRPFEVTTLDENRDKFNNICLICPIRKYN